jgi:Ser/Thr protein kinase RdoA (MazF antagonist)
MAQEPSQRPDEQAAGVAVPSGMGTSGWGGFSGSAPTSDAGAFLHLPTPTLVEEAEAALKAPAAAPSAAPPRQPPTRASFDAGELAMVCSRYDIGVIESVRPFKRGSGRAPKVVIKTDRGRYLLKRRAAGPQTPVRVAFSHAIQSHLSARKFPLPLLITTRTDQSTILLLDGHTYELFEFIAGDNYDLSLDATADAGRALGLFHRLLVRFHASSYSPAVGSYHNAPGLRRHLDAIASRLHESERATVAYLADAYDAAASSVEAAGIARWPHQIIHGDWHPGNMLFKGSRVAAVIDYDTARLGPRAVDLANGALQFSITMRGQDPRHWPEALDEGRLKRFCRGYETVRDCVISVAELRALPWLMIEALIVEAAVPIAMTGSFAGLSGAAFLRMVESKTRWIAGHADRLSGMLS